MWINWAVSVWRGTVGSERIEEDFQAAAVLEVQVCACCRSNGGGGKRSERPGWTSWVGRPRDGPGRENGLGEKKGTERGEKLGFGPRMKRSLKLCKIKIKIQTGVLREFNVACFKNESKQNTEKPE